MAKAPVPAEMSDGEIYSLASFGWDREEKERYVASLRKLIGEKDPTLLLTEEMEMFDNRRSEAFITAFVCDHDWPGRGCPQCELDISGTRQLRKAFPMEALKEAVTIANAYGREKGITHSFDDIHTNPAFAALVELVWVRQEQGKITDLEAGNFGGVG